MALQINWKCYNYFEEKHCYCIIKMDVLLLIGMIVLGSRVDGAD